MNGLLEEAMRWTGEGRVGGYRETGGDGRRRERQPDVHPDYLLRISVVSERLGFKLAEFPAEEFLIPT